MTKWDFLGNLKAARNLFFHRVHSSRDTPDLEAPEVQFARSAIWLTPGAVRGFKPRDFPELTDETRDRLEANVKRFAEAARRVPATKAITPEQVRAAIPPFLEVVRALEPYFAAGGELDRVRDVLQTVPLPDYVVAWECTLGDDSTGDPAVWVWLFAEDSAPALDRFLSDYMEAQRAIHAALVAAGIERWPYVWIRTAGEQRALLGAG